MPRPTSTHEQREAVRLLALAVGVREAARKLGLNESRVQAWSARYNWFPSRVPDKSLAPLGKSDLATIATKACESLADYGKNTRLHLAKAADRAATRFSEMKGEKVIDNSRQFVNIATGASKIHGWDAQGASNAVNLNVLSGGRAVVQVKQD